MKGVKVNIEDVRVSSSFELTKFLVRIVCFSKNLFLSETHLHALTYFVINGYNTISKEKLIENKLLKTKNTVANMVTTFRQRGIIIKSAYGESIHPDFVININDADIVKLEMIIKK